MTLDYNIHINNVEEIISNNIDTSSNIGIITALKNWEVNKDYLYKKFNNRVIVKSETISSVITESDEIDDLFFKFKSNLRMFFASDIDQMFYIFKTYLNSAAVGSDGFYTNKLSEDFTFRYTTNEDIKNPIENKIELKKGMKFSKTFKYFFPKELDYKLKELQNYYSTFTQKFKSKREGKIFLSIHPLDYLSISDNLHNWGSCHNMEDGDYRAGNLSYMADGVTIVAYYTNDENFNSNLYSFNNIEWNSKQWRMLIHIKEVNGKLMIIYNKQYPYQSTTLLEATDEFLMSFFKGYELNNLEPYNNYKKYLKNGNIFRTAYYSLNYNDIVLDNECYIRIPLEVDQKDLIDFMEIGHSILCLNCGSNIAYDEYTGYCEDCSNDNSCENCGTRLTHDDRMYIEQDDIFVCSSCYEEYYNQCSQCKDNFHYNDIVYNDLLGIDLCLDCNKKFLETKVTLVLNYDERINMDLNNEDINTKVLKLFDKIKNDFPKRERICKNDFTIHIIYAQDNQYVNKKHALNFSYDYTYDLDFGGLYRIAYINDKDYIIEENSLDFPIIESIEIIGVASEKFLQEKYIKIRKEFTDLDIPIFINKEYCLN